MTTKMALLLKKTFAALMFAKILRSFSRPFAKFRDKNFPPTCNIRAGLPNTGCKLSVVCLTQKF